MTAHTHTHTHYHTHTHTHKQKENGSQLKGGGQICLSQERNADVWLLHHKKHKHVHSISAPNAHEQILSSRYKNKQLPTISLSLSHTHTHTQNETRIENASHQYHSLINPQITRTYKTAILIPSLTIERKDIYTTQPPNRPTYLPSPHTYHTPSHAYPVLGKH